jgi:integrative and conjugative element protein (TIGR02256 family)
MATAAEAAFPRETGGILLGHREGRDVHVERAIAVPDKRASGRTYVRSHDAAQKLLDEALRDENTELLGWVGEWHTHPEASGPSPRDLRELSRLAREDGQAVAVVVLIRKQAKVDPTGPSGKTLVATPGSR